MPTRPPKRALQTAGGLAHMPPRHTGASRSGPVSAPPPRGSPAANEQGQGRAGRREGDTARHSSHLVSSAARGFRRSRARQPESDGHVRQHRGATRAHERRRAVGAM